MTAAERVQALRSILIVAGCDCRDCGAARARLETAFLVCALEAIEPFRAGQEARDDA